MLSHSWLWCILQSLHYFSGLVGKCKRLVMYYSCSAHNSREWYLTNKVWCASCCKIRSVSTCMNTKGSNTAVLTSPAIPFMPTSAPPLYRTLTLNSILPSHSFFHLKPPLGLNSVLSGVEGAVKIAPCPHSGYPARVQVKIPADRGTHWQTTHTLLYSTSHSHTALEKKKQPSRCWTKGLSHFIIV